MKKSNLISIRTRNTAMIALAGALLSVSPVANAAIPREKASAPKAAREVLMRATQEALSLPLENRIEALKSQGPNGYRNLAQIMFDKTESMEARWRSTMAVARIGGLQSRPELERAMTSPEWYMRNAGLMALAATDIKAATPWAKKLITDKALIVRTAAVDVLAEAGDRQAKDLLWQKLNSKENFKNGQSLFIRRRIVEALARIEGEGRESKFIAVLSDKDSSLHGPAIVALERITKTKLGTAKEPVNFKREHWQRWWKDQGQKSKSI